MIVQIERGLETQTLAVKLVEVAGGHVLTFNDISQQLADHRRAAWADVARRIAHERSEEPTSELQSLMRISYDVFRLHKQNQNMTTLKPQDTTKTRTQRTNT